MNARPAIELTSVLDVDLAAYLIYRGIAISKVTVEAGRVIFHFPKAEVAAKQAELVSGKARVSPLRWSGVVRNLHLSYLRPEAKLVLCNRERTGDANA